MNHTTVTNELGATVDRFELDNGMVLEHQHYAAAWRARAAGANDKQGGIYVWGAKEPTLFNGILEYTMRGEDPEMDAAWDAYNKLIVAYQRAEITKVTEAEDFGDLPESLRAVLLGKLRFDRHAGCSCSCSPGWLGANRSVLGTGGRLYINAAPVAEAN